ncbi:amidase [uncultured Paenalcaligenes sp.]|uniref:amidase n=1 Tax=uncultured Paenalcaligenes sp. TaxID=1588925 RepID=UPI00262DA54A|nr:amidase [uncultured Paenalcaligenes sp.]
MPTTFATIRELQHALNTGETTAVALTELALARIADPNGQGATAFINVYADQALAAARASDILRQAGLARSALEGIPISIKDLFDYKGDVTRGASALLKEAPAATENATLVQRLLEAGAVIIGRTNMTEFAFSGLGINPHYGTPMSPWDRETGRIPGGSSSGAGVSVADGMAVAAIGTDTGGSIRIPSAFCGITGFKPTAERISANGVMPLSHSLDSSGPLALSVECCALVDAVLSNEPEPILEALDPSHLRLLMPTNYVFNHADDTVLTQFHAAVAKLKAQGVQIDEIEIPELDQLPHINRLGGFVCAEAWFYHKEFIEQHESLYDPRVGSRILRGKEQGAADYIELQQVRELWIAQMESLLAPYDGLLLPTTPVIPPTIAELADEDAYFRANGLILRNPAIINFLNGCALSLPCHSAQSAPVGLMLAAPAYHDAHLLNVGHTIESILS